MRVGVIGCGYVSGSHIPPILRQTGVEIVGVADTDEERAREIAHRFGIRYVFRDAAAMLRERRPDVVHVLTPPRSHKELSIQAMEAGCHVLVEKPMAVCVSEADEMIAASRRHGVTLGVCHNLLFIPAVMEAQENHIDVIIIGTGAGGGTLAYALAFSAEPSLVDVSTVRVIRGH